MRSIEDFKNEVYIRYDEYNNNHAKRHKKIMLLSSLVCVLVFFIAIFSFSINTHLVKSNGNPKNFPADNEHFFDETLNGIEVKGINLTVYKNGVVIKQFDCSSQYKTLVLAYVNSIDMHQNVSGSMPTPHSEKYIVITIDDVLGNRYTYSQLHNEYVFINNLWIKLTDESKNKLNELLKALKL